MSAALQRPVSIKELRAWRDERVADGTLIEVAIEGGPRERWALGAEAPVLRALAAGRVPRDTGVLLRRRRRRKQSSSRPRSRTGCDRARALWNFDYTWEVYVPAPTRQFGYCTLPVLWGDALIGRFDGRLDRTWRTLHSLGLWLEDGARAEDPAFVEAFACGMERFLRTLAADRLDVGVVRLASIRRRLAEVG